jgi:5-(carboxyamino)imidazole ribonucleotide mutase
MNSSEFTADFPQTLDVLILLGSISDKPVAEEIAPVLKEFGLSARFEVCSAHRDHERLGHLLAAAEERGVSAIIAIAGKAAHLPGVCAAVSTRPVIGVPVESGMLGLDALLSIAQMPPGIPVASVGVGAGKNAALLAVSIAATSRPEVAAQLKAYRQKLRESNRADSAKLKEALGS